MKVRHLLCITAITALSWGTGISHAAGLTAADKDFLDGYEKVRAALVADDLNAVKAAAASLGNSGPALASSTSLKEARAAFDKLTSNAKNLTKGEPGYIVVSCAMVKKEWIQGNGTKIGNPYAGLKMADCGEVVK